MRQVQVIRNATAQANTGQTDTVQPPTWAVAAIFFLNWTATAGTTPLMDFTLNSGDPVAPTTTTPLEGWDGITQLSAVDLVTVSVGPHRTALDDTGVDYHVPCLLPPFLDAVITLDRTSANETYSYSLSVAWIG